MDTSWWLAVAAVVAVAVVAGLIDTYNRLRKPHRRTGRPRHRPGRRPEPRQGEIWWADVPYEDRPGSKDRPCLVIKVDGETITVAKITSKYNDERPGVIPLPPGTVSDSKGRASFLETDELREVDVWEFRRKAGAVDPVVWDQVKYLADS